MNNIINKINNSKHIVVVATGSIDSICSASAFYTYLLTLHKKVSFFSISNVLEPRLFFIPWSEKVRSSFPSSSDLAITFGTLDSDNVYIECEIINFDTMKNSPFIAQTVYDFFENSDIKINHKMATSLYSGILDSTNGFLVGTNGTIFAMIERLVKLDIDIQNINKCVMQYMSLASFRLKAIMQMKMQLMLNAKLALFVVKDEDISSSGATEIDCEKIILEALFLPTVSVVLLVREYDDSNVKILLKSDDSINLSKLVLELDCIGNSKVVKFDFLNKNQIKEKKLALIYKEIEFESKK